jgi:TolB-like protein
MDRVPSVGVKLGRAPDMTYLFAGYALDAERRELRHGDRLVPVEPQVFDLLEYLIRHRNRVVSKHDIFEAIWHGRAVSESALTSRINAARSAIGDSGEEQCLIRTLRGKGLRFVGAVQELSTPVRSAAASATGELSQRLALPDRPSIAVLPFTNMSGDPEQQHFADGISEDIITALSRVGQFIVIARNSTFQYKHSSPDVREVATALGVRYVVEGSVRKVGGRVRISAQLIDGGSGKHVWAERFDRDLGDIFAIQDEITRSIVGEIVPELGRAEYERTMATPPENLGAWELFHRGMTLIARRTKDANAQAQVLLKRSLELDPVFAPAHAALAWSEAEDLFFNFAERNPKDVLDRARRAVVLDHKDPLAHLALAWALTYDRKPDLAIDAARRAIGINPSYAHAHATLGRLLVHSGQCQEGIEHIELALRLSPSDRSARQYLNILAVAHLYLGYNVKAVELARQGTQTFDTWASRMVVTSALGHLDDPTAAEQSRIELETLWPGFSIEKVRNVYLVFNEACLERLLSGLRKAGVPDK